VYDFPALTSSLEKLITNEGLKIGSITGTDDEVNQSGQTSNEPVVVEMPFTVSVNGTYQNINNLVLQFEKSIRPFNVTKFVFAGGENGTVDLTIDAKSFYQPAKNLEVKKETVK
jgi:Tfp pilus assembly protein PilO